MADDGWVRLVQGVNGSIGWAAGAGVLLLLFTLCVSVSSVDHILYTPFYCLGLDSFSLLEVWRW